MAAIERAAYAASAELAREKGAFPLYDAEHFLAAPNVRRLPEEVREAIAQHGIRNGLLTSIAPTGTISLLAGNVSSGIEPVFDFRYERRVLERDGSTRTETVEDYAHALYRADVRPRRALTAGLRDGGGARPPRASRDAGRAPGARRQLHLQDHQLPRRHLLCGLQGRLPRGLRPRPQGLHHLPAQRRDGLGAEPHGRAAGARRPRRRARRRAARRDSAAAGPHPARPAGRGRLHGQAARARGRARRLHLQDPLARLRPRHVHHHQRHGGRRSRRRRARRKAPALRDLHQLQEPRALCLDGGAHPHDQRHLPPRRRRLLRGGGAQGRVRSRRAASGWAGATCRACSPPSAA